MNQRIHCRLSIPGMSLMVLLQNVGIAGESIVENDVHGGEKHRRGNEAA